MFFGIYGIDDMKYYVTGDKHADFSKIIESDLVKDENIGIIILGDAGLNFFLDGNDKALKQNLTEHTLCTWYCVRGNHEARPQDVKGMKLVYDDAICGEVYMQPEYPNIKYLQDGGVYNFGGYKTAVIGGAYSVDKWWRLNRVGIYDKNDPAYKKPKRSGWFWNEQLTADEMQSIYEKLKGDSFDFIFSHTCPISWQPTDLFLSAVNQHEVDSSMELWMDELKNAMNWKVWCFGHYHQDRLERPHVEMYYHDIESLDDAYGRWQAYDNGTEVDWYLVKSPNYYMGA